MAFTDGFLTISIRGADSVEVKTRQFATFGRAVDAEGLIPVWSLIGEDLQSDFVSNMVGEGRLAFSLTAAGRAKAGFGGRSGWPQLAPATVVERTRLGYGGAHPILWREGWLGESLASKSAPYSMFEVTPRGVTVGTSLFYAGWHQSGTRYMPARPIVGVTFERASRIVARLNEYIMQQVRDNDLDG